MRYELLGNSGLRVSQLSLGTMTFGEDWGWGADPEACAEMFDQYAEAGGNFVDTANRYTNGTSEEIVGDLLEGRREEFVLATKYTLNTREGDPNAGGNHRKNLFQAVDASLDRLDTDYVDLLWLHAWDGLTPIEEVMRGLDDLVSMGKVHYIGFSDTPAWVVAQAQQLALERDWAPLSAIQIKYTLTERTPERDLLPMARALDLGVVVWSPLDQGILTGKYLDGGEGRLTTLEREISDEEHEIAREVAAVAEELDVSAAQVALAWIRQQEGQQISIVGATKPGQLADNLGSLDLTLGEDYLARLDEISAVEMGFPHDFLASERIQNVIFGGLEGRIDPYAE
jgi:aryl-alcohol dehydrogenase-like predicted oxidoreductase